MPFVLVEGNAELTPARLVGHFDPALVLARGYRPDIFVDGPLLEAIGHTVTPAAASNPARPAPERPIPVPTPGPAGTAAGAGAPLAQA